MNKMSVKETLVTARDLRVTTSNKISVIQVYNWVPAAYFLPWNIILFKTQVTGMPFLGSEKPDFQMGPSTKPFKAVKTFICIRIKKFFSYQRLNLYFPLRKARGYNPPT